MTDTSTLPPPVPATEQQLDDAYNEGYNDARASTLSIGVSFILLSIGVVVLLMLVAHQRFQIDQLNRDVETMTYQIEDAEEEIIFHLLNLMDLNNRLETLEQRLDPVSPCPYEKLVKLSTSLDDCAQNGTDAVAPTTELPPKPGEWTGQP